MISRTSSTPVWRGGVHLHHVGMAVGEDRAAVGADAAGLGGRAALPSGPMQLSARAMMRAVVVLPTPRTPVSMKACATRPGGEGVAQRAHHRLLADQLVEGLRAVFARQHPVGGVAAAAAGGGASPNRPGPSCGGVSAAVASGVGSSPNSEPPIGKSVASDGGPCREGSLHRRWNSTALPGGCRGGSRWKAGQRPGRKLVAAASFRT